MKIESVITECIKCRYCKRYVSTHNNYSNAFICDFDNEDENKNFEPFLIDKIDSSGTVRLDIPDNCPLEDYENRTNNEG